MKDRYDVVIVGAGAAGLAALERLDVRGLDVVALEARDRVGGRALTRTHDGLVLDEGCGWLHSADRNVLADRLAALGTPIDKTLPPWGRQTGAPGFDEEEQRAFGEAFAAFEARLEAAAREGAEGPASRCLDPNGRWNGRLNAISSYYNGAEWDQVSILDYDAYVDTGVNWRAPEGYGAGIARLARLDKVVLGCPVAVVDHTSPLLKVETARGDVRARVVVVTVSSTLLAEERLTLRPTVPAVVEAAAGLPLGVANKAFLRLKDPSRWPTEGHLSGRPEAQRTAGYHLRPFGRPYLEAYFGGRAATELEGGDGDAFAAFAMDELVSLLGSDVRGGLEPIVSTAWASDPYARGSYSHALPGFAGARAALARPIEDRIFFAGEATHPFFFSTAHGAWESGVRAAEEARAAFDRLP